ncbi:MAG: response regulator, partial [Proteobacteria bacterium]|nr:response regulator [Pseudomonadota bacterium]
VLVVDDEPMLRETLRRFLAEEGYVVDLAVDGESALAAIAATPPDAILLDLMMPGMNGRQFLQTLRSKPELAGVPVLVMTAVHGLGNLANLGASDVVEKPFDVNELLNKVALAVYRSRGEDPAQPLKSDPAIARREPGVVLVIEHDRERLAQLDLLLSQRGYTVVSMTRALTQIARLARALRPQAILVDLASEGATDVIRDLRAEPALAAIQMHFYTREPTNAELVALVDG